MLGEVHRSNLQAVEEQASAAEIDVVAGDGTHHDADGVLDIGACPWVGDDEGSLARLALPDLIGSAAELIVVVAEVAASQRRAAATLASGFGVLAAGPVVLVLVVCDHFCVLVHGSPGTKLGKVFETGGLLRRLPLLSDVSTIKCKSPAREPGFFFPH